MSVPMGIMISQSLKLCMGYAERLLKDVPPEQFARFAKVGDVVVESNHPAFILGHLSLYGPKIVEQLGHDSAAVDVPDSFDELFNFTATCQDDPEGTIYPSMEVITKAFFDGYNAALEKLEEADDSIFQEPNPNEGRTRELFPTKGAMHMFYVGGHINMHLGQMSAWRRMQGLGAA